MKTNIATAMLVPLLFWSCAQADPLAQRPGDSPPAAPRPSCTSDAECGEGYSCWYRIPRGPSAGIPGSKERPGQCWPNEVIRRTF